MNLFHKIFGIRQTENEPTDGNKTIKEEEAVVHESTSSVEKRSNGIPNVVAYYREMSKGKSLKQLNSRYFDILNQIKEVDKRGDIKKLLGLCQESMGLMESFIKFTKKEYGSYDIPTVPALEKALIYLSVTGNSEELLNIKEIVFYFKELHPYKEKVRIAFYRKELALKIYQYIKSNPNCPQNELKKNLDCDDGRLISTTVKYMEKAGKLISTKDGNKIILNVK